METPAGRSTYTDSRTSWPHDCSPTDAPNKNRLGASWMAPIVSSIEIARPQDEVLPLS
jgi:hypothetical protein